MKLVLDHLQIEQKITRLAHEIIENTYGNSTIFLGGITGNGELFSNQLAQIIRLNSSMNVKTFSVFLHKEQPLEHRISCDISLDEMHLQTIILVDDVINSGTTMQYAVLHLLQQPIKTLKTLALVDRMHRRYPIKCDFVGITLTTTLGERVEVLPNKGHLEAFLV